MEATIAQAASIGMYTEVRTQSVMNGGNLSTNNLVQIRFYINITLDSFNFVMYLFYI